LPNYDALASAASMISQNQMAGQLNPQDLANAQTWAAQRGIATGTGFGSSNNMAAYQQFLGLSAQQLEQQGLTNYQGLLAGAPRTTDTTGIQTTDNNVLAAEYAAAPNPYAAAMANLAAQQAGLSGGAGAGAGAGAGTGVGGQSAYQAAQAAAAAHGSINMERRDRTGRRSAGNKRRYTSRRSGDRTRRRKLRRPIRCLRWNS
jgi:hypothetical protein